MKVLKTRYGHEIRIEVPTPVGRLRMIHIVVEPPGLWKTPVINVAATGEITLEGIPLLIEALDFAAKLAQGIITSSEEINE